MALMLMDGFDHYAYTDAQKKGWSENFTAAMSPGRFGTGQALNWTPFAATVNTRCALKQTSTNTVVFGFGWRYDSTATETPLAALFDGGTPQITIGWDGSTGKITARLGDATGALIGQSAALVVSASAFNHLETKVVMAAASAGTVTVKFNGAIVLSLAGVTTISTANAYATHFGFLARSGAGGNVPLRYDDLFVIDSSGTLNNDFIGDCRVLPLYPSADGTYTAFTPSTAGTHFNLVGETILNTADFVSSSTVGNTDSYLFTGIPASSVVKAVQVVMTVRKDDAFARSVAPVVRQGTTDYVGANVVLTASWQAAKQIYETNPATALAWVPADVNADQFGVKVTL